jgi:hypothetical protein
VFVIGCAAPGRYTNNHPVWKTQLCHLIIYDSKVSIEENEILLKKASKATIPEKPRLLKQLKKGKFNIPDFIYVSASDFKEEKFDDLNAFLDRHRESFKVITRSAHPQEEFFKGGTWEVFNMREPKS